MTGLGPFTMQVLIPSLPGLAVQMGTGMATVQLTLTLYLVGVALAQLVYGPLSDRFGRRPVLYAGLALHLVASVAALLAPTIHWLILARVGQAAGGCAGMVLGRAMIRDVWPRDRAASVMGYVTMAMTIAPMLAPVCGAWLDAAFGWRATMALSLLVGLGVLLPALRWLPETLPAPQPLPGIGGMLRAYGQLFAIPSFVALAMVCAWSVGVFFAFMAGAPFVVVNGMGYPPQDYAVAFMLVSLAFAAGNFTAGRLSARLGVYRMMGIGTVVTAAGALASVLVQALLAPGLVLFFLPMALMALGNGMSQPSAIAAAVSVRPALAGTASGLVGALQMAVGALLTVVVGLVETGSGLGMALTMLASAVVTQVALARARRLGR
jgi:DHA1 family bicyclomycin/chloramphenicol resistance-like MFS transporter